MATQFIDIFTVFTKVGSLKGSENKEKRQTIREALANEGLSEDRNFKTEAEALEYAKRADAVLKPFGLKSEVLEGTIVRLG